MRDSDRDRGRQHQRRRGPDNRGRGPDNRGRGPDNRGRGPDNRGREGREKLRPITPEAFAERSLKAVARNQAIIVVPRWWKALWYLERLSPALSMRAAMIALKRTREVQLTSGS